jgi:site-specific DNA-adenine methylase
MKEVDFKRIEDHQKIVKTKDIQIICGKYSDLDLSKIDKKKDVIYLDPPYIASKFKYGGWEKKDEELLLEFSHRNQINQNLIDWSVKYNVKNISMSYNSWAASVSTVKVEKNTNEVIISNF